MTFKLSERTQHIRTAVGKKQLCWFGVRGIDAPPLSRYGTLSHIYSQTAPVYDGMEAYEKCLETVLMHRVDLNMYDIDFDQDYHSREFKRTVLFGVKDEIILVPYRPQEFLSSIYFTHGDIVSYFGLFHKFQRTFEHKPWVEKSLSEVGVNVVPWEYVRNIERDMVKEKISEGKTILIRPPYSSGGAGYAIVKKIEDIYTNPVSASEDGFFSVAPFFEEAIPININACIYRDGSVRAFLPSYQLIGVKESTNRQLGYCGNDFGAVKQLGEKIINGIEEVIMQVGAWLAKKEYIGIFGADLLVENGRIYLVEINPRFQGSTLLASKLSEQIDDADPYGEHLAAFLNLDAPELPRLWERTKDVEDTAQLIAYNRLPRDISLNIHAAEQLMEESNGYKGIPRQHVTIAPEGMIFKRIYDRSITEDGYKLFPEVAIELTSELTELKR
jgi:hypothetical protein